MPPIERVRIVQEESQSLGPAGGGQLAYEVAAAGVEAVEVGLVGAEQTKTVMVAGGEVDVLHAGGGGHVDDLSGVEILGVEGSPLSLAYSATGDALAQLRPCAALELAVNPVLQEESEIRIGEPLQRGGAGIFGVEICVTA